MNPRKGRSQRRHKRSRKRRMIAAGLIERVDNHFLILRPGDGTDVDSNWRFPMADVAADESPEAALRRHAQDVLGMDLEIIVCQPPIVQSVGGEEVEFRFMFCGIVSGNVADSTDREYRWVLKGQLCEYEFDSPSQSVVDWMLAE